MSFHLLVFGQPVNQMVSRAPIPKDFITPAKSRFEAEKTTIQSHEKRKVQKTKADFYLQSNYQLDYILKSGKVIFNEDVYEYLNQILDRLTVGNPELKNKLHVFPIKYDFANAFTFNEGFIFINIGLIARIDNEAELAFILGHEISHYTNMHSVKRAVKNQQISSKSKQMQDAMLKMSRFSRQNEFEADLGGLDLILKSPYDPNSAVTALEMLYLSDLPFAGNTFSKNFFECGTLRIPSHLVKSNTTKKKSVEFKEELSEEEINLKDSLSSHPGIEKRIEVIKGKLAMQTVQGRLFVTSGESEFKRIRQLCREEMGRLYAANDEFVNGLFHNFLLFENEKVSLPIVKNKTLLLTKLAVGSHFKNYKSLINSGINKSEDDAIEEGQNKLRLMLLGFTPEEFHLIALKHAVEASKKFPADKNLHDLSELLIKTYREWYGRELSAFAPLSEFSDTTIEALYRVTETATKDRESRVKKAKAKKARTNFENSFARYAISDLIANDKAFIETFNKYESKSKTVNSEDLDQSEDLNTEEESKSVKSSHRKSAKEKPKIPGSLGTDKIILMEPQYTKRDYRKGNSIDLIGDEKTEQSLIGLIQTAGNAAGLEIQLLAPNEMAENDIDQFNDYCNLKNWMLESLSHGENNLPSAYGEEMSEIRKRYNTRYVTVAYTRAELYKHKIGHFLGGFYLFMQQPLIGGFVLGKGFFPKRYMNMSIGIFDLEENKLIYFNEWHFKHADSPDLVKSQLYTVFQKIKKS